MITKIVCGLLVVCLLLSVVGCVFLTQEFIALGIVLVGAIICNAMDEDCCTDPPCEIHTNSQPAEVDPPEQIPCACAGDGGLARVTIRAGANLTPNPQYCFIKLRGGVNWTSAPQPFGPGTNVLEFSGLPPIESDCELLACLTTDYSVASSGNSDAVPAFAKSYVSGLVLDEWRSANVEYDCMTGYDIQGDFQGACSALQKYTEDKYRKAQICPIIWPDEMLIPAEPVGGFQTENEVRNYLSIHWWQKFSAGVVDPMFILDGCVSAIHDASYTPLAPLPELGKTFNFPSQPLGKRGAVSVIYVQRVRDLIDLADEDKATNWLVAHEMAHMLAGLHDYDVCPNCHRGQNCLMADLPHDQGDIDEMRNGSFCSRCIENIKANDWEWEGDK